VTQRGNNKQRVFLDDGGYRYYLKLLKRYVVQYELEVWAYCLMPNHVHLMVVPKSEDSLGSALRDTHACYARYVNWKHGLTGHLWQGRFFSCPLDVGHTLAAARYVERNPTRARLVEKPQQWPWSSAEARVSGREDPLLAEKTLLQSVGNWRKFLAQSVDSEVLDDLRRNTRTGRPLGSEQFTLQVEMILDRIFQRRPTNPRRRSRRR
jgi:putative transposase